VYRHEEQHHYDAFGETTHGSPKFDEREIHYLPPNAKVRAAKTLVANVERNRDLDQHAHRLATDAARTVETLQDGVPGRELEGLVGRLDDAQRTRLRMPQRIDDDFDNNVSFDTGLPQQVGIIQRRAGNPFRLLVHHRLDERLARIDLHVGGSQG